MIKLSNATEENIKVILRIKPTEDVSETFLIEKKNFNSVTVPGRDEFIFDKVGDGETTQDEIFESCKNLFQSFVDGYNATIFAYGQTGSGKTFTMMGDIDETGMTNNPGLIPRGLSFIFDRVNEICLNKNVEYLIKCSFVEIYNEQIYDLLDPQQQRLHIRLNISQEVYLEQCTEVILDHPKMANEILKRGLLNRHMASTKMNRESSRSHAVFSIVLESRETIGEIDNIKKSCLHLVDLAGSERQRDSQTEGLRLKEAGMINKSLLILSLVIRNLVEAAKKRKTTYIAYRNSKLTLLLKDALGGNSKTALVACIHNEKKFMSDTCSTLQFANSVKMIKNKAKMNINIHGDNEALRNEICFLRDQLQNYKVPRAIQNDEFDVDVAWKKRFVTAMSLRSCLSLEVSTLHTELSKINQIISKLEKSIDNYKIENEIQEKKIKYLESTSNRHIDGKDEIIEFINTTLKTLKSRDNNFEEEIKSDELQIQVNYLTKEVAKYKNNNLLSLSDKTFVNSLMKDYNNIIESDCVERSLENMKTKDAELIDLQEELSKSQYENTLLKMQINKSNINRRDERRKLEAEIASLKSNLKILNKQREDAVIDRRRTLLSINDFRSQMNSPVKRSIKNDRRQTHNSHEDENDENDFQPLDEWLKKNDEGMFHLEQINQLENELRLSQTQIGSLEYSLNEYRNEIEELRNILSSKEKVETNIKEIEEKYLSVIMNLEDTKEKVLKLETENASLEESKDIIIKKLMKQNYDYEEEIKAIEEDIAIYKDESERSNISMMLLNNELKRMDDLITSLQKECSQKDLMLTLLNSDNISVFEELAYTKEELWNTQKELEHITDIADAKSFENENIQKKINEFKDIEQTLQKSINILEIEIESLRSDNNNFAFAKERAECLLTEFQDIHNENILMYQNKISEFERQNIEKKLELIGKEEEYECQILQLNDEIDKLKKHIDQSDKENNSLKTNRKSLMEMSTSFLLQSPRNTSSPLQNKSSCDHNSRSSFINELVVSNCEVDKKLKEEREKVEEISKIVESICNSLQWSLGDSLVENINIVKEKVLTKMTDFENAIINKLDLEERLKVSFEKCTQLEEVVKSVQHQRDEVVNINNGLQQKVKYEGKICVSLCQALETARCQRDAFRNELNQLINILQVKNCENTKEL